MERLVSFCGLFGMLALAWLMSSHRRRVSPRIVIFGVALQFALAALILKTDIGLRVFALARDAFTAVLSCTDYGTNFLFGKSFMKQESVVESFAFRALPVIIFFSSLMSVLYYLGVMQWIVRSLAWVLQKTLRTSGAETLAAVANIFAGQTEAPLVIRPYLSGMTQSELMSLMVGGFATVAGSVLAVYASMGVDAGHMLTASVISAPAALVVAKLMQPEVEQPETLGAINAPAKSEADNLIHAVALGAADGLKLALNVAAMLIAFLAMIYLVNLVIGAVGESLFGRQGWSLQLFLGYVFYPIARMMGVEQADCRTVGQLLGVKMVANEFLAYSDLTRHIAAGELSPRSQVLATYALCGFANFGSIGIQIGGISPLAPNRRSDIARLGFRAMLGGTLAACMTACVVGVLL